jgi:hypothetical protein
MQTDPIKNVSKDKKRDKKSKDQKPKAKPEAISNWEAEGGALLPEDIPFVPSSGLDSERKQDQGQPEKKENNGGNGERRK